MSTSKLGQQLDAAIGQQLTDQVAKHCLRAAIEDFLDADSPSDAAREWFDDYFASTGLPPGQLQAPGSPAPSPAQQPPVPPVPPQPRRVR
jgi:hypothetical protein